MELHESGWKTQKAERVSSRLRKRGNIITCGHSPFGTAGRGDSTGGVVGVGLLASISNAARISGSLTLKWASSAPTSLPT